jgi:hypothetical protein
MPRLEDVRSGIVGEGQVPRSDTLPTGFVDNSITPTHEYTQL